MTALVLHAEADSDGEECIARPHSMMRRKAKSAAVKSSNQFDALEVEELTVISWSIWNARNQFIFYEPQQLPEQIPEFGSLLVIGFKVAKTFALDHSLGILYSYYALLISIVFIDDCLSCYYQLVSASKLAPGLRPTISTLL